MSNTLDLKRTASQGGIELWRIDTGHIPIAVGDRPQLAYALQWLLHALSRHSRLTESVWLDATHIHEEGTTKLLGPNASAWVPRTGFGIHPSGTLPRMWTSEDFSGSVFGHKIPIFNNQVFEISRATGFASAITTMAGRGVLLLVLLNGPVEAFKQQMNTVLGSLVKEESFHVYPYFFPLLAASEAGDPKLSTWMGNASIYIRESPEDKCVLLFSRLPLEEQLQAIGAARQGEGVWRIPVSEAR